MELRHYLNILRRSWRLIVGLPLVVGAVTLALGLLLPAPYTITAQMLVTQQPIASTTAPLTLPNYENYHSWLSSEYSNDDLPQLVRTRRFATDVANWVQTQHGLALDPEDLTEQMSAGRQHRMVSLTVIDRRQDVARYIAQGAVAMLQQNGLGYWDRQESASLKISEVDMPDEAGREQGLVGLILDTILRSLLAGILAIGLAFLWYYLDRSLHTRAQVEGLGIASAGVIPHETPGTPQSGKAASGSRLVTLREPGSLAAEGYRALRTRLQFGHADHPLRTLLVTSATANEDRADAVANLAVMFAQSSQRVVLVDADLRRPILHTFFGVSNDVGVSTVLRQDRARVPLQPTQIAGLSLLAAGPALDQSGDVLASTGMDKLIATLVKDADVVLFNTPPVTILTDAVALATKVDGVLVVLRAGKTNQDRAREAIRLLQQVNARVVGTVFTDAPVENQRY
jgi:capsular exopolysaccharide synthesis family protein